MKERNAYEKAPMDNQNIYLKFNDDNIKEIYGMIIGPKDTPYSGGFYFIKLVFSDKYPFEPPKGEFLNQYRHVRFNPNLYEMGKICLSILGTWRGPSWSAVMNTQTIMTSIQSLLHKNPIQNEPSFENDVDENYNILLTYYNIDLSVCEMLKNPFVKDKLFNEKMIDYFRENYKDYQKSIEYLRKYDKQIIKSKCYGMKLKIKCDYLQEKLNECLKMI